MMEKFIYVFTKDAADELASRGFNIVNAIEGNNIYVFENTQEQKFDFFDFNYVLSDTITF